MKYYKRLKKFKASNVWLTLEPEIEAASYDWWIFLKEINGKLIFNNARYSTSTSGHQRKVLNVLHKHSVKVDVFLEHTLVSLAHRTEAIQDEIKELKKINKRLFKELTSSRIRNRIQREKQLAVNCQKISKLESLIRETHHEQKYA